MYLKKETIPALRKNGRNQLASILEQSWNTSIAEFSSQIYNSLSSPPIEQELLESFAQECRRLGHTEETAQFVLSSLQKLGVLQTATHLSLSEGPTFFAAHQLATHAFPKNHYYIVAAFSGVPFSNSAWPGCFNYSTRYSVSDLLKENYPGFRAFKRSEKDRKRDTSEMRLSVIPGNMRDSRVYRAGMPEKLQQMEPFFTSKIAHVIPPIEHEQSFTKWALQCCEKQLRQLLPGQKIIYIDINEVISSYLQKVIGNPEHPMHRFFFDASLQKQILSVFGNDLPIFSICVQHKNKWKQEAVYLDGNMLKSRRLSIESLIAGLKSGHLCPGVFLTFIVLSFINGIKCLGSFDQLEYLHSYQAKLQKLQWLDKNLVQNSDITGLSTGRCIDLERQAIFPIDAILGTPWEFPETQILGDWFQPLFPRLIRVRGQSKVPE